MIRPGKPGRVKTEPGLQAIRYRWRAQPSWRLAAQAEACFAARGVPPAPSIAPPPVAMTAAIRAANPTFNRPRPSPPGRATMCRLHKGAGLWLHGNTARQ